MHPKNRDASKNQLFYKRMIKYLILLVVFIVMMLPIVATSYNLAKKSVINVSTLKLNEGVAKLQTQIEKMLVMRNILLNEKAYNQLQFVKGSPSPSLYIEINEMQRKLTRLSLNQDYLATAYVLFRDNPIFISNHIASDTYESIYPLFVNYINEQSAKAWYDNHFAFQDGSIHLLPSEQLFSSYYSPSAFNGITLMMGNAHYQNSSASSVLVCMLNEKDILGDMLYPDASENSFLYLADQEDRLLAYQNYPQEQPFDGVHSLERVSIQGSEYIVVISKKTDLGLYAVLGIPVEHFNQNITTILQIVAWYAVIGFSSIITLSFVFSLREAHSFRQIVDAIEVAQEPTARARNEYSYVTTAIKEMNKLNEQQINKIDHLNESLKASFLENLFLFGAFFSSDEKDAKQYIHNSFDHSFYVCFIHLQTATEEQENYDTQSNLALQMESLLSMTVQAPFESVRLSTCELAVIVFLDPENPADIEHIREEWMEIIRTLSVSALPAPTVNIGISKLTSGLKAVREAFLQAKDAAYFNLNPHMSGVYPYNAPQAKLHRISLDIAMLARCYDIILSGDKSAVERVFSDIASFALNTVLGEEEKQQLFFSMRQPLQNAYIKLSTRVTQRYDALQVPVYHALDTTEQILNVLKEFALSLCDIVEMNKRSKNDTLKSSMIEYIRHSYSDPNLSAVVIATELLISDKYVYSFIKEMTGKSLGAFIEEIRMEKAKDLLVSTDLPITRIYQMCGFGSDNTFYRVFSKAHGVSPTVWRRQHKRLQ